MKKGFTLVELLAVIVLLAIIALITYPNIIGVVEGNKETLLARQIAELEKQSRTWVIDSGQSLQRTDGFVYELTFEELYEAGLISTPTITDPVTKQPLAGCMILAFNGEINNFEINYDEDCEDDLSQIATAIVAKQDSVTIEPGTSSEITSYFTTTFGRGGTVVCKDALNNTITNTSSLAVGTHTITCTATGNNNTTANASISVKVEKFIRLAVDANSNGEAELGDEVCIGNECFYVLTNDGTNIRMLAKYRIDVSNNTTRKNRLQNTGTMTTVFSSASVKGTRYNNYEGSIVEDLVGDYKTTLEGLGATIADARLLKQTELNAAPFNCTATSGSCVPTYSWLYKDGNTIEADHWTSTGLTVFNNTTAVYSVYSDGSVNTYQYSRTLGVRPVVTIAASSL